jgi:hypothetical protein
MPLSEARVDTPRGAHRADPRALGPRTGYLRALAWSFTLFNSLRILAYLPTLRAIVESADSSQHSLVTWLIWVGANLTTAAWLREHNGRRLDCTVVLSLINGLMCLSAAGLIVMYRV